MTYLSEPAVKLALGHGFDVEKTSEPENKSGFIPARFHDKTGVPLMGDLRLYGFLAALRMNYCGQLLLAARDEERYPGEAINQAWAIKEMLVKDYDADPARITWIKSGKGTANNVVAMREKAAELGVQDFLVITNKYHFERSMRTFRKTGPLPEYASAESLWLAESSNEKERLMRFAYVRERWDQDLLLRELAEVNGVAHDLLGEYKSSYEGGARS